MREKLIALLNDIQLIGVVYTPSQMDDRYGTTKEITNEKIVEHLIANGVTIPVQCKDCKHWIHMEDGMGDCTNGRFHLDGCVDPVMKMNDFCSCGERKDNEKM